MAVSFVACSSSTSSDAETAVIQGSVGETPDQSQLMASSTNFEGTTATAARITANGTFETIQGTETEVNAAGEFTMEVDVNEASNIAIIAESGSETYKGFLSSRVENGQTYRLKPLDTESTAETEIFARVVASGNANIVNKYDVQTVVSHESAAIIRGNASAANQFATGLANAAHARAAFVAEYASENTSQVLNTAAELRANAQFELESALYAAGSAQQRAVAVEAFLEASANAYIMAGLDEASVAKKIHVYKEVFLNSIGSTSSEVRNHVRSKVALYASIALDVAVQAEAAGAGLSETTIQAIATAGAELKTEVKAVSGASSEIKAAFENYHEKVRTAVENDSSAEASVIISIDAEINATGGAKAIFNSSLSGTVNADVLVEIYNLFTNSVTTTTETHLNDSSELNVQALANLLLLINLAS